MTADATAPLIADDSTTLPLSGTGPFTVYVKVNDEGIPHFGTTTTAAEYTKIGWQPPEGVSSTQITFNFFGHNPISDLASQTSGLSFGSVSGNTQVATCTARVGTYHFTVTYSLATGGERLKVDPIIIITVPPMPDPR